MGAASLINEATASLNDHFSVNFKHVEMHLKRVVKAVDQT